MDFIKFKEELYQSVLHQIKEFFKSKQAKNIYAIIFDIDEFYFTLKYQTISGYEGTASNYVNELGYDPKAFHDKSLAGFKYSAGDFNLVDIIAESSPGASQYVKDFFDSIAYYECDYIEDKSRLIPRAELPDNIVKFLLEACLYCVERLKRNLDFLDKTNDFIIFVTEHDISDDRKLELISKTVDSDLFKKLALKDCDS